VSDEAILQVQVAGKTIMLKENEAALVVYANCEYRGKTVIAKSSMISFRAEVKIIERAVGNTSICAGIFPRIPMNEKVQAPIHLEISSYYSDTRDRITATDIFADNVAEIDLKK
jgi:hypothetical protein